MTLGKLLDFSDPQFAPVKRKRLARVLSEVPAIPVLPLCREVLPLSCSGNGGCGGRLGEVMVYIVAAAETLDLDL